MSYVLQWKKYTGATKEPLKIPTDCKVKSQFRQWDVNSSPQKIRIYFFPNMFHLFLLYSHKIWMFNYNLWNMYWMESSYGKRNDILYIMLQKQVHDFLSDPTSDILWDVCICSCHRCHHNIIIHVIHVLLNDFQLTLMYELRFHSIWPLTWPCTYMTFHLALADIL